MKKRLFVILLAVGMALSIPVYAEEDEDTNDVSVSDELDISSQKKDVEENGIPTPAIVEDLLKEATDYWNAKDYQNAASAYAEVASKSNYLANLISQGLEPFYSKRHDDEYDSSYVFALAGFESRSNEYKKIRNSAFVKEALCYYYLEEYTAALPLLHKSLDLIQVDDTENWTLAREALYDIIDIE